MTLGRDTRGNTLQCDIDNATCYTKDLTHDKKNSKEKKNRD